jgi:ABC-2 type transport system ATP-binding protein
VSGDRAAREPVSIAPATSDARRGGFLTEWNDTLAPFIHYQSRIPDLQMSPSIEAESLTKKFGDFVADDSVSFCVSPGETYGLLGPNGAGKTTLVRLLTTLLSPTSGTARIRGHDIVREKSAVRASIGTVSQAVTTDENLTVAENLSVQGKMYGLWGRDLSRRIARRLSQVGLDDRRNQITRELSGGMRRRLEIARGVLHSPRVLFLDEPTAGLDPQSRRAIWDMLSGLKDDDEELAVILTTHAMDEADILCDRVAILDHGRILCEDSPDALKRGLATGERVEIETDREIAADDRAALDALGAVNWRSILPVIVEFQAKPGEGIGRRAAQRLEDRGYRIRHLTIAPVTLEDVFFSYTGRALREV